MTARALQTDLRQALHPVLRQILAQVAQIHFQPSALTGLVMLAALAAVRPWAAAAAALASVAVLITARLARLAGAAAQAGLLGYNASLTGAGLLSLYEPGARVFVYLLAFSVISPFLITRWLRWGKLPALTFPFVLAMGGALALGELLGPRAVLGGCDGSLAARLPCGIGQVTFIAGSLPGLCVWAAITWHHRSAGLWLGLGAAAGLLAAHAPGAEAQAIGLAVNLGLIAQGLTVFDRGIPARLVGLALGAALCLLFGRLGLPYFTLPFNLATWTLLLITQARPPRGE